MTEHGSTSGSINEKVALAVAFLMFFLGMMIVWCGTYQKLLNMSTYPKLIELSSIAIGAIFLTFSTRLVFKHVKG